MDFDVFCFARARRAHFAAVWDIEDGHGRQVWLDQQILEKKWLIKSIVLFQFGVEPEREYSIEKNVFSAIFLTI